MGYLVLCLLVCCAVFNTDVLAKGHSKKSGGKIVGGYNTTIQSVPWQVYMLLYDGKDYYQCGGSIISETKVLTAAHCMENIMKVYIRIGSTKSDSGGIQYTSTQFKIHSQYNPSTKDYDIAIVTVPKRMALDGTNAKAVKLPSESSGGMVPANETIVVSGWGATSEGGPTTNTLMAVEVQTLSLSECQQFLPGITEQMFCAGPIEGGKDSCQGDSGGPAVHDGVQWGIVSFGYGCARPKKPGGYSNVPVLRKWIKTHAGV